jgi:UDP-glucuronate decarboxylase
MDFHRRRGLDVRVARIFDTYGPRMAWADGRVISNFIAQALRGDDLTVYGDGSQTRSFCYVDDLVDGLVAFMKAPDVVGPLNLGNPVELTILELAHVVLRLTGSASPIVHHPLPPDDPKMRRPVIARARKLVGVDPKIALEQGLRRTISAVQEREATAHVSTLAVPFTLPIRRSTDSRTA